MASSSSSASSSRGSGNDKRGKGPTKPIDFANHTFVAGELYDVLDPPTEVWSPGKIVQVYPHKVLVHYPGWDSVEHDVEIPRDEYASLFAPAWTHVLRCKCWVSLTSKLPLWPCVVQIRKVIEGGSEVGESYLRGHARLFVIVYGDTTMAHLKPWQGTERGVWLAASNVSPFHTKQEERIAKGDSFREPVRSNFMTALKQVTALSERVSGRGRGCGR